MKIATAITEFLLLAVLIGLTARLVIANTQKPKVAIVIDDFGNNQQGTDEMLNLPITFTGAVMPYMPNSVEEMNELAAKGKEVILHQPMEAHTGKRSWLGATPILGSMSIDQVKEIFNKNADQINKAIGFNNHMGSLITEDREKMTEILKLAKERGWFYVDSVTSSKSVAYDVAKELGVPAVKRDVFLDSTQSKEKIKENMMKAVNIAKEKGSAVAIGHVGAEGGKVTAEAIKEVAEEVGDSVEFVGVSEIVEKSESKE